MRRMRTIITADPAENGVYVWELDDWPRWRWDDRTLSVPLAEVSRAQGVLLGRLADLGLAARERASLAALTEDVVDSAAIEGERLDPASVRSSIARRLGVDIGALAPADRRVEGMVETILDATVRSAAPVTGERLKAWQAALFPTGRSGLSEVATGRWRDDVGGPMQVVSGPTTRPRVHFEAPPAERLDAEMDRFTTWIESDTPEPALLKAGLAHLWLVTVHPFDDGNGRVARAVGDLMLARADGSPSRFYSVSAQVQRERRAYYEILERTQKGDLDVTGWLAWFLEMLGRSVASAEASLDGTLAKARFWRRWSDGPFNARQAKLLNRLLDGFDGRLTSRRWASMAHCSPDTALRDINALVRLGVLRRGEAGGRSTWYELVSPD